MAGVRRGVFTCVGWKVTLCDPIWQVTLRSCDLSINSYTLPLPFYRAMHYVHSAVLRLHGVRLSVRPSVRLSVCNVGGLWSHTCRLEILKTDCTDNYPNTFVLWNPNAIHLVPGEHGEILGRLEVGGKNWRTGAQKRQYLRNW